MGQDSNRNHAFGMNTAEGTLSTMVYELGLSSAVGMA